MLNQFRFPVLITGLLLWVCSTSVQAIPAEGTCICDSFGCSKVVGGTWVHATSCPSSGTNTWQTVGAHYSTNSSSYDVTVHNRRYTLTDQYNTSGFSETSNESSEASTHSSYYQPPAQVDGPQRGWGLAAGYANTDFSSSIVVAGQTRKAQQLSLNFQYAQDYDDWGYLIYIPVKRMDNNGVFGALNDSSIGAAFMPTYHLLHQQVHGIKLDLAGVVGYDRHWINNKAALTNPAGSFALPAFDDPSSWQAGALARLSTQLGNTGLNAGISQINVHHLANQNLFGSNVDMTIVDLGARRRIGEKSLLGLDLAHTHLSQVGNAVDRNFGDAALLWGWTDRRRSWQIRGGQTFSNSNYQTRSLQLSFGWVLD